VNKSVCPALKGMHRVMKKWMIKLSGEPFLLQQTEEPILAGSASEAG
jgi:hypothetical protein